MAELTTDFLSVTEIAGTEVSKEQVGRLCHRYYWAGEYARGKDVAELACGSGQGLGYLNELAKTFEASDCSEAVLGIARARYQGRVTLKCFDAQEIPYADSSKDLLILFEALYYIPDADRFVRECRRVLRPGGKVLIATANPGLFDFNPSPHSYRYFGVCDLQALFGQHGFSTQCFGYMPVRESSLRQRILRPVKKFAVTLRLMPRTMRGKRILKRLVFGKMVTMPHEVKPGLASYTPPTPLDMSHPDRVHKVIYCVASRDFQAV